MGSGLYLDLCGSMYSTACIRGLVDLFFFFFKFRRRVVTFLCFPFAVDVRFSFAQNLNS